MRVGDKGVCVIPKDQYTPVNMPRQQGQECVLVRKGETHVCAYFPRLYCSAVIPKKWFK